ncbi:GOLPH3/VPS74 family protein [Mycobacterium sp. LTG2003]
MELPQTLHGQLYLLAYDHKRHRFDAHSLWLLGFALRAAMLTDLHLSGYIQDSDGKACRTNGARPGDPLLRSMLNAVRADEPKTWAWLVAANQDQVPRQVREQLTDHGWLCTQRHRALGFIPKRHVGPYDADKVSDLADRAAQAVRNIICDREADPRPLALGLLGILSEIPTIFTVEERVRYRLELLDMTAAAIAPISALHAAVESVHAETRGRGSCGGGGSCGSGCGGGCGGCGG